MNLYEMTPDDNVIESKLVWAKGSGGITRKYRCTFGKRKGRTVSNPAQCSKPIDMKKRFTLKKTKSRSVSRMARKANRTKRMNPASRAVARMNKAARR